MTSAPSGLHPSVAPRLPVTSRREAPQRDPALSYTPPISPHHAPWSLGRSGCFLFWPHLFSSWSEILSFSFSLPPGSLTGHPLTPHPAHPAPSHGTNRLTPKGVTQIWHVENTPGFPGNLADSCLYVLPGPFMICLLL